ncbi:MAG TPA: hypothetical protein VJ327_11345 [Patescibacteria group bacterium]|nr:hypothetical protein [Patescibacteria group bacterium]
MRDALLTYLPDITNIEALEVLRALDNNAIYNRVRIIRPMGKNTQSNALVEGAGSFNMGV